MIHVPYTETPSLLVVAGLSSYNFA
jgi:hypothetical protein